MTKEQSITTRRTTRRRGRRLAAACAALALGTLAAAVPASASVLPAHARTPILPAPTGRYQVGETALHLVDRTRTDPWHSGGGDRELMVSVYYPAARTADHRDAAPYMLPRAAAHFDAVTADGYLRLDLPTGRTDWSAVATRAVQDAPVAAPGTPRPVLLYSPGLGEPRSWGTTLVADLASRGYIVVTVDNTYESPEVQFPDGSLATLTLPADADPDAFIRKSLAIRVADTRFVLDQLHQLRTGHNPDADGRRLPDGLAGALDLGEVGMFGHSMGGTTAALAMDADPRIRAGVDLDGNLTNYDDTLMPVAEHGLARPFLLLGKDGATDTGPGWQAFRAHTPGWSRQLTLRGSEHASFTDAEALLPQLCLPPANLTADIGTIAPRTAIRTTEAYLTAYFDHWLRGGDGRLLDRPSPAYPAMEFIDTD